MEKQLTKRQRRLLKKQQREEDRLRMLRRRKIRKIVIITLPIILLIGGIIFALFSSSTEINQGSSHGMPRIKISPEEYDVGTVSISGGLVKHTYEIKNIGDGDLKIDRIWTSCMCTTARLRVGDKSSSEFGMHSAPVFWSQKIFPAETGYLEIVFDPAFHGPSGVGQAMRAIYISTNDPQNKKAEARLLADVIP